MAYDEAKLAAMRGGDPEPDGDEGDDEEAAEPSEGEPSATQLAAAKRLIAAVGSGNARAVCAAVKDISEE